MPPAARTRIGLGTTQVNALVWVVLRPADRTLTDAEANELRDRIYAALHEGGVAQWATAGHAMIKDVDLVIPKTVAGRGDFRILKRM